MFCIPCFKCWVFQAAVGSCPLSSAAIVFVFFFSTFLFCDWRMQFCLVKPSRSVKKKTNKKNTHLVSNCSTFFVVVFLKTMLNLRSLHTENACNENDKFSKIWQFNWLVFICINWKTPVTEGKILQYLLECNWNFYNSEAYVRVLINFHLSWE